MIVYEGLLQVVTMMNGLIFYYYSYILSISSYLALSMFRVSPATAFTAFKFTQHVDTLCDNRTIYHE